MCEQKSLNARMFGLFAGKAMEYVHRKERTASPLCRH